MQSPCRWIHPSWNSISLLIEPLCWCDGFTLSIMHSPIYQLQFVTIMHSRCKHYPHLSFLASFCDIYLSWSLIFLPLFQVKCQIPSMNIVIVLLRSWHCMSQGRCPMSQGRCPMSMQLQWMSDSFGHPAQQCRTRNKWCSVAAPYVMSQPPCVMSQPLLWCHSPLCDVTVVILAVAGCHSKYSQVKYKIKTLMNHEKCMLFLCRIHLCSHGLKVLSLIKYLPHHLCYSAWRLCGYESFLQRFP